MKNIYKLICFFGFTIVVSYVFSFTPAVADTTHVSGTIVNQTWTTAGSPYVVESDIVVAGLTINPGVSVLFGGNYEFRVQGVIIAVGTYLSQIHFTTKTGTTSWKGIYFFNSNPGSSLKNCIVEKANNSGIRIFDSFPNLDSCIIRNNSANSYGGGMNISNSLPGTLLVKNCIFENNLVSTTSIGGGGGVNMNYGNVDFFKCQFLRNSVTVNSSSTFARGGGIAIHTGVAIIRNCKVFGNKIAIGSNSYAQGGGIAILGGGTVDIKIKNSVIAYDTAISTGSNTNIRGGGIFLDAYQSTGQALIENCTIIGNNNYGIYRENNPINVRIVNSIVYYNQSQIAGPVTATYNNIQGGFSGTGNITFAPILDSNFHVLPGSACIDAGNDSTRYNDVCFPPSLGGVRNDMGFDGGPGACDNIISAIQNMSSVIPSGFSLNQNYPNPFNPTTNIEFDISKKSFVKLLIYNTLGKVVSTLVNEELNAGSYQADWDAGEFPTGVYFYKLETEDFVQTKSMVLLK